MTTQPTTIEKLQGKRDYQGEQLYAIYQRGTLIAVLNAALVRSLHPELTIPAGQADAEGKPS